MDGWYRREHPGVFRLCFGFLADYAEAEDLAQDAMLRLLDRLPRWDPQRPYSAWRNTVVLNLCRDHLRSRKVRRRAEQQLAELPARPAGPAPEQAATQAEIRDALHAALGALPPREREAFVLRDLEGQETADAAAAMGVAESSVRSLLTLARRRLRRILEPALLETAAVTAVGQAGPEERP